ncbi:hypothetical protein MASR2M17_23810 [Aminivibrio sp.]
MKKSLIATLLLLVFLTSGAFGSDFDLARYGAPKIEDLYLVIIRDPDAQLLALQRAKVDILGDLHRPVDVEALSKNKGVELSLASGFHGFFLGFNVRSFPWNRLELRRSSWQALPRERMVRDLFGGYAEPLSTFLPPVSPVQAEVTEYPFDPEAARKPAGRRSGLERRGSARLPGETVPPQKLLSPPPRSAPTAEIAVRIAEALSAIRHSRGGRTLGFLAANLPAGRAEFSDVHAGWQMTGSRLPPPFTPRRWTFGRVQHAEHFRPRSGRSPRPTRSPRTNRPPMASSAGPGSSPTSSPWSQSSIHHLAVSKAWKEPGHRPDHR